MISILSTKHRCSGTHHFTGSAVGRTCLENHGESTKSSTIFPIQMSFTGDFPWIFPLLYTFIPSLPMICLSKKKNLLDDSKKNPRDPAPGSLRLEWPAVSSAQVDDALSVSQSIGSIGSLRLNKSIYIYIILYYTYYNDTYIRMIHTTYNDTYI